MSSIQNVVAYAHEHEDEFVRLVADKDMAQSKKEMDSKRRELEKAKHRISELDALFKRLYEDNVNGRLSDERFERMSADYEAEQKQLVERVPILEADLAKQDEQSTNAGKFLGLVRKYTNVQELSSTLLREFVDKIIVHEPDKSSGKREQKVEIHYNFVGKITA